MVIVSGRVTESAPTQAFGIPGAVLTISEGVNAGRTARADASGFYTFFGLKSASFTIRVSADGFMPRSESVNVTMDRTLDFQLPPVAQTMTVTSTLDIGPGDGTCSDSVSMKPCRILSLPVHNAGTIAATLHWTPNDVADLDLTLFEKGKTTPILRSMANGSLPERIEVAVEGGAQYELRVTYRFGTARTDYTVSVTYPY